MEDNITIQADIDGLLTEMERQLDNMLSATTQFNNAGLKLKEHKKENKAAWADANDARLNNIMSKSRNIDILLHNTSKIDR